MRRSLRSKMLLARQAKASKLKGRDTDRLARTVQIARSTVEVEGGEVPVADVLTGAVADSVTVGELDESVGFLDADSADYVDVDAGVPVDPSDVLNMVPVFDDGAMFDGDVAADEASHVADMTAIEALDRANDLDETVTAAQAKAEGAVEAAASAERTALGLARVRSETEPVPPEGGWQVGAEWVREVDGRAREVFVWDGAGWVHAEWLINELLIPGEDGAIQIGNGAGIFPRVVGGVFEGGTYYGGEFIQYATDDMALIYPAAEGVLVAADWRGGPPDGHVAAVTDTSVKDSGSFSVRSARTGAGVLSMLWTNADRTPATSIVPRRLAIKVRSSVAVTGVHVVTPDGVQEFDDLPANTWTWLDVDLSDDTELTWAHVGVRSSGSAALYVDEFRVVQSNLDGARMMITRNRQGLPGVFIVNGEGEVLGSLTPDGLRVMNPTGIATPFGRMGNDMRGTTAQMTAYGLAYAVEGSRFFNTDDNRDYVRKSGAWTGALPLHGRVTLTAPSGGGQTTQTVTFPTGYFAEAPAVHATLLTGAGPTVTVNLSVDPISASSASIILNRSNTTATTIRWSAFPIL